MKSIYSTFVAAGVLVSSALNVAYDPFGKASSSAPAHHQVSTTANRKPPYKAALPVQLAADAKKPTATAPQASMNNEDCFDAKFAYRWGGQRPADAAKVQQACPPAAPKATGAGDDFVERFKKRWGQPQP